MSLGWTAPARGLRPPNAILVFYCPTDYQADWWKTSHFVWRTSTADLNKDYDIWDAVRETPITGYNISGSRSPGGWMSTSNSRARIPLHMNWTGQTLPILFGALSMEKKVVRNQELRSESEVPVSSPAPRPCNRHASFPQPSDQQVAAINPLSQVIAGVYRTPTYFIHGEEDDFIPCEHSRRTHNELRQRGISAGLSVVPGGGHLFEMLAKPKDEERMWRVVLDGYQFLFDHVGMTGNQRPQLG